MPIAQGGRAAAKDVGETAAEDAFLHLPRT
jgi:hypothetical protein